MAVLVHRCDRSVGYCRTVGHECDIAEETQVQFEVEETSAVGKPKVVVSLGNHTRCDCSSPAADFHRA